MTLNHLSPLDLYDHLATLLLAQGKKSILNGTCMYRGPDKLMCAAGPCIPDDKYNEKMEGNLFHTVNDFHSLGYTDEQLVKIRILQSIHDERDPKYWAEDVAKFRDAPQFQGFGDAS